MLKAIGVEYLLYQAERTEGQNLLHIAAHFSNLIKVSENAGSYTQLTLPTNSEELVAVLHPADQQAFAILLY